MNEEKEIDALKTDPEVVSPPQPDPSDLSEANPATPEPPKANPEVVEAPKTDPEVVEVEAPKTDPEVVEVPKEAPEDEESKAVLAVFDLWIKAEIKLTSYFLRHTPQGQKHIRALGDKMSILMKDFIMDGKLPDIKVFDRERAEKSLAGFWQTRTKKSNKKRADV